MTVTTLPRTTTRPRTTSQRLPFGIAVRTGPDGPIVRLSGELDLAGAEHLGQILHTLGARDCDLIIDVADLVFCDCAGLGVLLDVSRDLRHRGFLLTVHYPSGQLRRLIDLTGTAHQLLAIG